MAKYEVTNTFKDLQDNNKLYKKGQTFPRPTNKKIEEERILELLSSENRQKKQLIKKVED
ncbi:MULTISPECIES: hypothetical protein [Staphylococcus]|uniref:Phage protein n=1 Tax=Staphylococcus condimenti TaxID=70255 RepID=A0AB37H5L4_9STAP|nr:MULTISPECIES: hypothetical protein [Staphylococcus]AMY05055.1 hypothetical protein A4G25_03555 [Staphylococcus condimenti]ANZ33071.1 hypothetical protein BEK99_04320 [Staphylococcus carnosus]PNZ61227.1 hypothetical protein CD149_05650 [Staphylococcus condimenti]PNZ96740.1 hypothetical protein CD153_12680 [Staphylococcus carnosus]QQS83147.1 hypothetical protein I6J05_02150 [Staphylococcus condimenti]